MFQGNATEPTMTETIRSTAAAIWHASPAIGLISLILWSFSAVSIYGIALVLDIDIIGLILGLIVFAPATVWANWHVVRLAIESEKVTD
jgi:hypothetical protein